MDNKDEHVIGIYEVFKTQSINQQEVQELVQRDFPAVRKRFSVLKSIDRAEDVLGQDNIELAIVPPASHMIVDRNSFATLLKSKVEEALLAKEKELRLMADEKVCRAAERITKDRLIMAELFKTLFLQTSQAIQAKIQECDSSEETVSKAQYAALKESILAQNSQILSLLSSPHFTTDALDEDDQHDQQQPSSSSC